MAQGAVEHFTKPLDAERLVAVLRRHLLPVDTDRTLAVTERVAGNSLVETAAGRVGG